MSDDLEGIEKIGPSAASERILEFRARLVAEAVEECRRVYQGTGHITLAKGDHWVWNRRMKINISGHRINPARAILLYCSEVGSLPASMISVRHCNQPGCVNPLHQIFHYHPKYTNPKVYNTFRTIPGTVRVGPSFVTHQRFGEMSFTAALKRVQVEEEPRASPEQKWALLQRCLGPRLKLEGGHVHYLNSRGVVGKRSSPVNLFDTRVTVGRAIYDIVFGMSPSGIPVVQVCGDKYCVHPFHAVRGTFAPHDASLAEHLRNQLPNED